MSSTSASQLTKDQIVVLYDKENDCVGGAVVSSLGVRDLLEGNKIHPTEDGASITAVYKPTTPVNEIFKDTLRECLQCTKRWPRCLLRATGRYATNMVNVVEVIRVFEFSEDGICAETPPQGPNRKSALGSVVGSNSSPILDFQCHVQDGLPHAPPRRPYSTSGLRLVDQHPRRLTREDRNKVTLQSIELVVNRCKCSQKCLSKVSQSTY